MITVAIPKITAIQAQAEANYFLLTHLGDRFVADDPSLDSVTGVWRVPVLLSYSLIGPVGKTGEVMVSLDSEQIVSHTPLDEMKSAALALYEQHRDEIEAPLP